MSLPIHKPGSEQKKSWTWAGSIALLLLIPAIAVGLSPLANVNLSVGRIGVFTGHASYLRLFPPGFSTQRVGDGREWVFIAGEWGWGIHVRD